MCHEMKQGSLEHCASPSVHPSVVGLSTSLQCTPFLPCALSHCCCAGVVLLCSYTPPKPPSLLTLQAQVAAQQCQRTPVLGSHRALPGSIAPAPWHCLSRLGSTLMSHLGFPSTPRLSHVGCAGNTPIFSSPKAMFCDFFSPPLLAGRGVLALHLLIPFPMRQHCKNACSSAHP